MKTNSPSQLGMVGLGRMGSNMVRRLLKAGHQCTVFDVAAKAVENLAGCGFDLIVSRDVAAGGHGSDSRRLELLDGFGQPFCAARSDNHAGPRFAESVGNLQAQAAAAAGDQSDLANELKRVENSHRALSLMTLV